MRASITELVARGSGCSRRWGQVDVTPGPIAAAVRRLDAKILVYPPGTSSEERYLMTGYMLGVTWKGSIVVAAAAVTGGLAAGRLWGAGLSIGALLLIWIVAFVLSRKTRHGARAVHASFTPGGEVGVERFTRIAGMLDDLDSQPRDTLAYESEWWRIYDEIEVAR